MHLVILACFISHSLVQSLEFHLFPLQEKLSLYDIDFIKSTVKKKRKNHFFVHVSNRVSFVFFIFFFFTVFDVALLLMSQVEHTQRKIQKTIERIL